MQAARGTSLTDDSGLVRTPAPRRRRRFWALQAAVFAVVYGTDQVTKALAVRHLTDGREHSVVGDLLTLHLTRNPGAAFSAGTAYTTVLSCLAAVAVLVVLWLSRRIGTTGWAVALGLLLAGIGGNLTDRLLRAPGPLRGHVVDFLQLPHWPIFNVADVSINVAAAVILVQAFRGVRLAGGRAGSDGSDRPDGSDPGAPDRVAP